MYESILKTATNQSNFQFRLTTRPFPISQRYRDQEQKTSTISLIFVVAVGFSMIPANIVGAILREREKNLKHLQLISGLDVVAYHFVNIVVDIVKAEIVVGACISLFAIFRLTDYYWSLLVMALWPVAVIPITHALSFMFTKEWSAQFFIILINFIILGVIPITISSLMFSRTTFDIAETINYYSLLLPGYSVSRALLFSGYQEAVKRFKKSLGQEDYSMETWTLGNFDRNLWAVGIHSLVGIFFVLLFENVLGCPNPLRLCTRVLDMCTMTCM